MIVLGVTYSNNIQVSCRKENWSQTWLGCVYKIKTGKILENLSQRQLGIGKEMTENSDMAPKRRQTKVQTDLMRLCECLNFYVPHRRTGEVTNLCKLDTDKWLKWERNTTEEPQLRQRRQFITDGQDNIGQRSSYREPEWETCATQLGLNLTHLGTIIQKGCGWVDGWRVHLR